MNHAFLIMAHSEFDLLEKIIQMLDAPNHDIYVHIDKKVKNVPFDKLLKAVTNSKIYLYQELYIYWGSFSQTECEILLMEKAHSVGYDYYHLLSGADLPLVTPKIMDDFFEKYSGTEFVYMINPVIDKKYYTWYSVYHPFQSYLRRSKNSLVNGFFWALEGLVVKTQVLIKIDRVKHKNIIFQKGANWFSITDQLVKEVISKKEWIKTIFRGTRSSDELFLQTILRNSKLFEKMQTPKYEVEPGYINTRYIDWKRGKPYIFKKEDYFELVNSGCLFARKFSENVDKDIVDRMYNKIMEEKHKCIL